MASSAKRDPNGTWRIQYRYTDWTGKKRKSQKRGFKTSLYSDGGIGRRFRWA